MKCYWPMQLTIDRLKYHIIVIHFVAATTPPSNTTTGSTNLPTTSSPSMQPISTVNYTHMFK